MLVLLTTTDTEATMPRPRSGAELRSETFLRQLAEGECLTDHPRDMGEPMHIDAGVSVAFCWRCCRLVTLPAPEPDHRGRLDLRARHERMLSARGLVEAAKDGRKDFRYVPEHGGGRASVSIVAPSVRVNGKIGGV
jgi:hypothetical protein